MNTTFRCAGMVKCSPKLIPSAGRILSSTQRISGVDEVRRAAAFVHKIVLLRGCSAVRCSICPQNGHSAWMQCGELQHLSTKWCFCVDAVRCAVAFVHKMVLLRGCSTVRCGICPQNGDSAWMQCGEFWHLSTKWHFCVDAVR